MTWASPKGSSAYPTTLSRIVISVILVALLLTVSFLVSHPISSTIGEYFYSIDSSQKLELSVLQANQTSIDTHLDVVHNNVSSDSSTLVPPKSSSSQDGVDEKLPTNSNLPTSSKDSGIAPETQKVKNNPEDDNEKAVNKNAVTVNSSTGSLIGDNFEAVGKNPSEKPNSELPVNSTIPSVVQEGIKDVAAPVSVPSSGSTQEDASSNVTKNETVVGQFVSQGSLSGSNFVDMGSNNTTPAYSDSKSDARPAISPGSDTSNVHSAGSVDSGILPLILPQFFPFSSFSKQGYWFISCLCFLNYNVLSSEFGLLGKPHTRMIGRSWGVMGSKYRCGGKIL